MNSNAKRAVRWLLVVVWCAVIFCLSAIPYLKIETLGFWDFIFRKIAHVTEFAVLSILLFRAVNFEKKQINYFWPVFLSIVYAASDEIHQGFVPGRGPSVIDVGIDTAGVIMGILAKNILSYFGKYRD